MKTTKNLQETKLNNCLLEPQCIVQNLSCAQENIFPFPQTIGERKLPI